MFPSPSLNTKAEMSGNESDGFIWEPLFGGGGGLKRALSLQRESKKKKKCLTVRRKWSLTSSRRMLNSMTMHMALLSCILSNERTGS